MDDSISSASGKRWAVVLPAMVVPFLFSWLYFVILPGTAVGNGLYVLMKILLVVWPLAATGLILRERIGFRLFRGREPAWKVALTGLVLGAVILAAMALLLAGPMGEWVQEGADRIRERVEGMGVLGHFLAFALFISVLHSLIEEFYWRWFVFGNLRLLVRPSLAHGLAALAFSAHHFVVLSQYFSPGLTLFFGICVAVGGLLWSGLMARQGSLLGAWLSHLLVDLGLMAVGARLMGLL